MGDLLLIALVGVLSVALLALLAVLLYIDSRANLSMRKDLTMRPVLGDDDGTNH